MRPLCSVPATHVATKKTAYASEPSSLAQKRAQVHAEKKNNISITSPISPHSTTNTHPYTEKAHTHVDIFRCSTLVAEKIRYQHGYLIKIIPGIPRKMFKNTQR